MWSTVSVGGHAANVGVDSSTSLIGIGDIIAESYTAASIVCQLSNILVSRDEQNPIFISMAKRCCRCDARCMMVMGDVARKMAVKRMFSFK